MITPEHRSPAYQRFLKSMKIGYMEWHDGIGYDLDALHEMKAEESAEAEALLIGRLKEDGDWRDVEALADLPTPTAREAVQGAKKHHNSEVRNKALRMLVDHEIHSEAELEEDLARAVEQGDIHLADKHRTPRIKRALLDCCRLAEPTTRVNAAGMLMYICGKTDEPFDWNLRPFFLRFGTDDNAELRAAWIELRQRTGI